MTNSQTYTKRKVKRGRQLVKHGLATIRIRNDKNGKEMYVLLCSDLLVLLSANRPHALQTALRCQLRHVAKRADDNNNNNNNNDDQRISSTSQQTATVANWFVMTFSTTADTPATLASLFDCDVGTAIRFYFFLYVNSKSKQNTKRTFSER